MDAERHEVARGLSAQRRGTGRSKDRPTSSRRALTWRRSWSSSSTDGHEQIGGHERLLHRYITGVRAEGEAPGFRTPEDSAAPGSRPFRASAFRMPRSPAGNASGSPSARMAMYRAVHSPMPGRAFSAATVASLPFPSSRSDFCETARARFRMASARAWGRPIFWIVSYQPLAPTEVMVSAGAGCAGERMLLTSLPASVDARAPILRTVKELLDASRGIDVWCMCSPGCALTMAPRRSSCVSVCTGLLDRID